MEWTNLTLVLISVVYWQGPRSRWTGLPSHVQRHESLPAEMSPQSQIDVKRVKAFTMKITTVSLFTVELLYLTDILKRQVEQLVVIFYVQLIFTAWTNESLYFMWNFFIRRVVSILIKTICMHL